MPNNKTKRIPSGVEESSDAKRKKTYHDDGRNEYAEILLNELRHNDPVLQLQLQNDNISATTPSTLSKGNLLERIVHPLSPRDFKSSCFRKKAVHIKSNRKDRFRDINENYMFGLDPKQIFEETSSDSIFLWIPPPPKEGSTTGDSSSSSSSSSSKVGLQSIDIQDPNTAYILHTRSNYASYCRAPPELEQRLVSSMLRDVGIGCGQYDPTGERLLTLGRGEVETFIGTKGHLTDWHNDFQENFTIQLSGRKKWTLKQGTVKHPLRGTTPHYRSSSDVIENQIKAARLSNPDYQFGKQDLDSNAFGNEVEIIMDAGDVLYFPAGMWHKVETIEYGASINISLMGSTYASFLCKTLEHHLLEKEEWREVICSSQDQGSDVVKKLKSLINDLPSIVKKLADNGVAEGMLPPVLREPPVFQIVGEEEGILNDSQSCQSEDEGAQLGGELEVKNLHEEESASECEENSQGSQDEVEDENIIDVNEFESINNTESFIRSGKVWRRNPLASLMRMSDVKSFYESEQDQSDDTKNLFILNTNFAGNDMHESAVRVILRDVSGQLDCFCSLQGKSLDDSINELKEPPRALLYYGFII
ncbi:MAG: hypothetical protein ACI90V_000222 [Bacillariaceae sp.]|jgi:hypothetical protein